MYKNLFPSVEGGESVSWALFPPEVLRENFPFGFKLLDCLAAICGRH